MEKLNAKIIDYVNGRASCTELAGFLDELLSNTADPGGVGECLQDNLNSGRISQDVFEALWLKLPAINSGDHPANPDTIPPGREEVTRVRSVDAEASQDQPTRIRPVDEDASFDDPARIRTVDAEASLDESTRVRPVDAEASLDEPTRVQDRSQAQSPNAAEEPLHRHDDGERTRTRPSKTQSTHSRIKGPVDREEKTEIGTRSTESPSLTDRSQSDGSFATGSNWAHPEQWKNRDRGPVEPGFTLKERFLIDEQLGRGGMGTVFKARDLVKVEAKDSDPWVAIKVLNEDFRKHPKAMISLQREAKKAQTLAHPNIITVHDFDRDGTIVYMHMELMRGQSLSQRIRANKSGGDTRETALPIIRDMAAGLAYAHENDIVHSDFKPGNVFLTDDGRTKVLDFGIARARKYQVDENANASAHKDSVHETVFDAGELGGLTPPYASLEMINGEDPHPSDDVYALAITAYQLLTGAHPFKRVTAAEAKEQGLVPLPIRGLKRREWRTIAKGLEFERAERIEDARTFLKLLDGPRPITKTIMAVIVVLLIVSTGFAWRSFQPVGPAVPFAELPADAQSSFREHLAFGNQSIQIGDYDGAWQYFSDAWDVHPRNADAVTGFESIADALIKNANDANTVNAQKISLQMIERVSENPFMADHKGLRRAHEELKRKLGQ